MSVVDAPEADLQEKIRRAPADLIAARIREARGDLSHDRLGALMGGVTRQHLIKLEKGQHRPRAAMLKKLAAALERPVEWFIDQGPPNEPPGFRLRGESAN